jgi:hypothetical protein
MPAGVKSMSFVWSSPSMRGASSGATCIVVPQPQDASSAIFALAWRLAGSCFASSRITWRRRWICFCRAMWLSARLANWMSLCAPSPPRSTAARPRSGARR